MKRLLPLALALCFVGCSSDNETIPFGSNGNTATTPTITTAAAQFIDISSTGAALPLGDDQSSPVSLGFSFSAGGQTYSEVNVCSNGFLTFTSSETNFVNTPLPSTLAPNNILAVYWTDLAPPAGSWVYTQTQGTAPNREFIVLWKNAQSPFGTPGGITFEAILKEAGGVELQYLSTSFGDAEFDNGALATVGAQVAGSSTQIDFNGSAPILSNTGYTLTI